MNRPTVVKGLFFDLDGTISDTHEANAVAYQRALAELGHHVDLKDVREGAASGQGSAEYVPRLVPGIGAGELARVMERKTHHYGEVMHLVHFNENLINFLKFMKPGHVTALVTHAKKANAEHVLRARNLHELFDHLVFFDDVNIHKPDPAGYLRALELSGLSADEVLAFEDSRTGADAAVAAGIQVMMIPSFDEN